MPKRRSKYTPNKRRDKQTIAAMDKALMVAAQRLYERVEEEFLSRGGGFKHGFYAKGATLDGLQIGAPSREGGSIGSAARTIGGKRAIRVFTDAERDGRPYPLFWEVGHENYVTGNTEKEPVFSVVLEESRNDIIDSIISARPFGTRRSAGAIGAGGIEVSI